MPEIPHPQQEPPLRCASCVSALRRDRIECRIRAGYCTNCCRCLKCDCGAHVPSKSFNDYAIWLGVSAGNIGLAMRMRFSMTVDLAGPLAEGYCEEMDTRLRMPCRSCYADSWLAKATKIAKLTPQDYSETDSDTTVSNAKRLIISGRGVMSVENFRDQGRIDRNPTFLEGEADPLFPLRIFVSNEIEVASGGSPELEGVVRKWHCRLVPDGSLGANGFEINTAPAWGKKYVDMIDELSEELIASHGVVSQDCGLHVHVDMRDATPEMIFRLAYVWSGLEPQLFAMMPESRRRAMRSSWWCAPLSTKWRVMQAGNNAPKDPSDRLGFLISGKKMTFEAAIGEIRNNNMDGDRYRALNLASWGRHKTVEFRLHSGTILRSKIRPWTVICASLAHAAKTMTDEEVIAHCESAKPAKEKLLDLLATEEAREYVQRRQAKFPDLNTPERMQKVFDVVKDYRQFIGNLNQ